jgi:hypothetical protein
MNKIYLVLIVAALIILSLNNNIFAQDFPNSSLFDFTQSFTDLNQSIESVHINPKLTQLTFADSTSLSSSPNIPVGWAIVLNIVPAFGIGSFAQGDKIGGVIQCSVELISATVGILLIKYGTMGGATPDGSFLPGNGEIIMGSVILATGISVGVIFGIIKAILFNNKQKIASSYKTTHLPVLSFGSGKLHVGYLFHF